VFKTPRDDVTRGLGQLTEAIAFGYDKAALVTTLRKAEKINRAVFVKNGFILLAADSKGKITNLTSHCLLEARSVREHVYMDLEASYL
jgi:hypothetical protein